MPNKIDVYEWYVNDHVVYTDATYVLDHSDDEDMHALPKRTVGVEGEGTPLLTTDADASLLPKENVYFDENQRIAVSRRSFSRLFKHGIVREACIKKLSVCCTPEEQEEYQLTLKNPEIYLKVLSEVARTNDFDKCSTCVILMTKRLEASKNKNVEAMQLQTRLMESHMRTQRMSRQIYYHHQRKARADPSRYLCLCFDEMDGNKTEQPVLGTSVKSKDIRQLDRYKYVIFVLL